MPVFHRGRPIALRRRDDPSPGRRRHVGRIGADQRHRDLPGGHAHPAAEAARRRRLQRHAGRDDAAERAHPRHGRWATSTRRSPPAPSARGGSPSSPTRYGAQPAGRDLRRAARPLGDDDARRRSRAIPEGTYRYVDYLDNDGIELDKPIRIEVAVTVERRRHRHSISTGTSPQVRGPLNCVPSGSLAAACFAVRALTDPTIPTNGGCFRPITLQLPEGTHRQSAGAGAGQRAHLDDQAHHRLHPRRARAGAARARAAPTRAASCWCSHSAARAGDGGVTSSAS